MLLTFRLLAYTFAQLRAIVAILHTGENKYWLMLKREAEKFAILGWSTRVRAMAYFTDAYNRAHSRGYEPSMSACVNFIQFQPRIVTFPDIGQLERALFPPGVPRRVQRISAISGHYDVARLAAMRGKPAWESGASPQLITRDISV